MYNCFCENCNGTTEHMDITIELKDGYTVKAIECQECEQHLVNWDTKC